MKLGLLAAAFLGLCAMPASARDWTPHSAAAVLDASFPSVASCQVALDAARKTRSHARPIHGLSYERLFEQARCRSYLHEGGTAWRIRMAWAPAAR